MVRFVMLRDVRKPVSRCMRWHLPQEQLEKIRTGEQTAYMGTLSDTDKNTLAIAAAPVYIDGSAHTLSSYVFVAKDTSGLFQDTLSIIRRQFCIYAVLSLALSFAIIYIIILTNKVYISRNTTYMEVLN